MNGLAPTFASALLGEHQRDLVRAANRARLLLSVTDPASGHRHRTPAHRPAWWTWVTALLSTPGETTAA
jgi:hypothetical protein